MFENLTDKLERSFKILKGEGRITVINIAETLKEIRRALIDADVNYKVAKSFTDEVKQKALGQDVLKAVKPGQMMTKIVRDELALLMGGTATDIRLEGNPAVILIAGLQGSGKTTFSGKLASFIKSKKGRQVLLVAGDVYRPAAIDQLKVLGGQIGVEVYTEEGSKDPVQIAENAIKYARQHAFNVVIVDTAGRLAVDEAMMQEITAIKTAVKPSETLFVVDAMTGQDAVNTAREFNDRLDFDGVVLTKLDGDTRGGAAISIRSVVNKPLKFISSGEKMDALQVFHPERMADRILGMGDVVSLVERAQEQFDEEEARKLKKKLVKNQFNFNDFIGQIQQIKKMGNLKDLASMLPGMGKMLKNVDIPDDVFKQTEAIISSMTPAEREHPEIINARRRERIAKGSGTTMADVNRLMKQFEDTRKMMKAVAGGGMKMPKLPGMRRKFGRQAVPPSRKLRSSRNKIIKSLPDESAQGFSVSSPGLPRPAVTPDIAGIPFLFRLRVLGRIPDRNHIQRHDGFRKSQNSADGLHPLAAGIYARPYRPQPHGVGREKQVLGSGRSVHHPPVAGSARIAGEIRADDDRQRRRCRHLGVLQ